MGGELGVQDEDRIREIAGVSPLLTVNHTQQWGAPPSERRVKQAHRSGVERRRGQRNGNRKVIKPSLVNLTHSLGEESQCTRCCSTTFTVEEESHAP